MALALFCLAACAAKTASQMSLDPIPIQTERIQRIAVFPFESPPDDPPAGMHISKLFEMYLLQSGLYRIAERGDLDRLMKEKGLSAKGPLDLQTVQEWGKALQVDGMVFGMVSQYNRFNLGFTARLVSAKSGLILWSVSQTGGNVFRPLSQVADETVRAAVEEVKKKIR